MSAHDPHCGCKECRAGAARHPVGAMPVVPETACGEFWQADFGPMYCYLPKGHTVPHHTFGSRGLITWSALPPFEAHFFRAVAESMAEDLFRLPEE